MVKNSDKIIVSVSGGPDSVCLLRVLNDFRIKIDMELHLAHFHHGLRKESDEEADFVSQLAEKLELPISIIKTDKLKNQKGLQNKAREWRYHHLQMLLQELGFSKVALGHHLDDLIETQIWRMMRGSSLFSLNPMQAYSPPYIRPLLNTRKNSLLEYLKSLQQGWREDLSNESEDYTRNLIRHRIIPEMENCAGGKLAEKLLWINKDAEDLKLLFEASVPEQTYEVQSLQFDTITGFNPLLAKELIHRFLLFHGQEEITRANIEKIYELVLSGKGNWQVNLKAENTVKGINKQISVTKLKKNKLSDC